MESHSIWMGDNMNIIIYVLVLCLSIAFLYLGYILKDSADIFKIVGFGFIFLLGVILIPNTPINLEYTTGVNIIETETGYETSDILATYEDFTIGFFISLVGIFGFINVANF